MRDKHVRSLPRRWRLASLLVAALAAGTMAAPAPASASASAARSSASALRDFDAVTTVNERNVWKHLALIGDKYAIYNDRGLIEGPRTIREKWPFLPEQFTHDVDSAGIAISGPGFRWRHTWTKGNQAITFEDSGIITGPFFIPTPYDGISDFNDPLDGRIRRYAVRGGLATFLFDGAFEAPSVPLANNTFLPERFHSDLDDVSLEWENNRPKISYYKDNERVIFSDRRIVELVNLDAKWPFLNNWRATG
ncbi:hypothetical protein [Spongiactinospora sp. TRM90649]|uniref:hypothetical protein n=1 Tax=Spongiactinospora sp. TRM90649 TaxID=3031114 RepID=UPI0023F6AA24|nr:hypothetical protein [Spongiactinospora sp. TRM90649]MDF5755066.1 hypothetical protein [Spongiactinospora sp. TRM90649]